MTDADLTTSAPSPLPAEPHPDGHAQAEPQTDGHARAEPHPDGHAQAESHPDGHAQAEPHPDGHGPGEPAAPAAEESAELGDALAPVKAALLARARADAEATIAQAAEAAERRLRAAREEARRILTEAREQGAAEAAAEVAMERSRARRAARATVLAAREEAYETLRAAARDVTARLRDDPGYPQLRQRLIEAARRALGPRVHIRDVPTGGVIGEVRGRRIDLSLDGFAERAVQAYRGQLDQP